jgi:RNA polymerase sigma-B factor
VALLTDRQRLVLRLRYVDELTQGEIGERIGVSQMQVSRILRGIVERLRCELLSNDEQHAQESAA